MHPLCTADYCLGIIPLGTETKGTLTMTPLTSVASALTLSPLNRILQLFLAEKTLAYLHVSFEVVLYRWVNWGLEWEITLTNRNVAEPKAQANFYLNHCYQLLNYTRKKNLSMLLHFQMPGENIFQEERLWRLAFIQNGCLWILPLDKHTEALPGMILVLCKQWSREKMGITYALQ